jgi:hypothetical protein
MNWITSILIQQLAYSIPVFIVYLVSIVLALIFIRKYPMPAILTLAAGLVLLVTTFGVTFAQSYFSAARLMYGGSQLQYSQRLSLVSIPGSILRGLGTALLLAAVFVGRQSKTTIQ